MKIPSIMWVFVLILLATALSTEGTRPHIEQPLSKIAIHKTTFALNDNAYVKASPNILGSGGQNTEWVTVEIFSPNPSNDDWIGVFSPANFSASTCYAENKRVSPPLLCTAPIKYQYANYKTPSYKKTGKGLLKLQLINQRADYSFALFSGGLYNPKLVAVSNTVVFANPKAPVYPRLAQGKLWNEMTVTWTSGYGIHEAEPFVEWGPQGGEQMRSPAGTLTFKRNSMCGAPARTVGWRRTLPPGPFPIPIISDLFWLGKSFSEVEFILRQLRNQYGPVITVRLGFRPAIFISSHALAHQTLVQNGAIFADRPRALPTDRFLSSNQHDINSASYGTLWRSLRRNLTSEIFNPSRVKSYANARKWVVDILINRLRSEAVDSGEPLFVVGHFRYAMFCLLALMCFGEKLDEKTIRRIEATQRSLLLSLERFNILNFLPRLTKILFRKRWRELEQIRRNQADVLIPLIRAREENKKTREEVEDSVVCYVDTLLDLQLQDEKRNLNDQEMVSLCSEFLNGGTDTTSTALQWIMANLVKHQHVQMKLFEEIQRVTKDGEEIKGEDLQNMHYLKAVVLEGLRRHPPAHFVLPHAVTDDFMLDGYVVPKNGSVNFMVAEMGWDPNVWEDPMEFKPERFLSEGEVFDITGSREIKMMPFGAGRRICPGYGLALLHLEYFLANLVKEFEWKPVDGGNVDLTEKQEFTIVMKNPLRAHLYARVK